ncbi:MAG: HIT family protein [Nitrosopumilus sp.]|nr:HIT family protein [Nitrosopumilus sp.]
MDCIFCEILSGGRPSHMIYGDADYAAFLDRYPIETGHALIVPRIHRERITDMDPADVGRLFELAPRIARAVMAGTGADAFSLAQNNGRAARQIVPHVHVHVIPRYSGKGAVWTSRSIPCEDELGRVADMIRPRLQDESPRT